jgi:hypothetical protein
VIVPPDEVYVRVTASPRGGADVGGRRGAAVVAGAAVGAGVSGGAGVASGSTVVGGAVVVGAAVADVGGATVVPGELSRAITSVLRSAGVWLSVTSRVTIETPAALTNVATIVVTTQDAKSSSRWRGIRSMVAQMRRPAR